MTAAADLTIAAVVHWWKQRSHRFTLITSLPTWIVALLRSWRVVVMMVVMVMCRMMVVMLLLLLILCTVSGRTTRQGVRMVMVMVVLPRGRTLLLMTVRTILATKGSL